MGFLNMFILGDIMQLQFVKSALTVNPCMVSQVADKCSIKNLQILYNVL